MEPEQYNIMSLAEDRHWWYLGLRDAIGACLGQPAMRMPTNPVVLDAGCGTGANLRFLNLLLKPSYLAGFDLSELALEHARMKCPEADIYLGDIRQPELHQRNFDLIFSTDVLYVTGLDAAFQGLQTLIAALKPGGFFVGNLPAYDWLASEHDRVVHTRERFTEGRLRKLLLDLDLECVRISYRLFALFPLIVLMRLPSLLLRSRTSSVSDLRQPSEWLNVVCLRILQLENRLIARGFSFPWGSSILVVGRKPEVRVGE